MTNDYREYNTKGKMIAFHEECYAMTDATGSCKVVTVFFAPIYLSSSTMPDD